MIDEGDILHHPFSADLTRAGIEYIKKAYPRSRLIAGQLRGEELRRQVVGIAANLVFRRSLALNQVHSITLPSRCFSDPERPDIGIGARRCVFQLSWDPQSSQGSSSARRPLFDREVTIGFPRLLAETAVDKDLYIFVDITARVAVTPREQAVEVRTGEPLYLINLLPDPWSSPGSWRSLGQVELKTDLDRQISLDLVGLDRKHSSYKAEIQIPSRTRLAVGSMWNALSFLGTPSQIEHRVAVVSPVLRETLILEPEQWCNIWVYGDQIRFLGYLSRGEIIRKAKHCLRNTGYEDFAIDSGAEFRIPVCELHSLSDLINRARKWDRKYLTGNLFNRVYL